MAQLFSNNASGTLALGISNSDTTINLLTGEGAEFQSPTGGNYELITLAKTDGTIEICKVTARSGDALTVTRGQEGTTAIAWTAGAAVKGCATAATLSGFPQGFDSGGDAKGSGAVNLQPSRSSSAKVASGAGSIVLGKDTTASGVNSIAVGNAATSRIDNAMVMSGLPMARKAEALGSAHIYGGFSPARIISDEIDLLTLADNVVAVTIPTGASFYVESMFIIITQLTGTVTVHPQISFGTTSGNTTAMLAATALANEALKSRQNFSTPLLLGGQTALSASVKTAGTGFTLLKGRVGWVGMLVEDQ